MRASVSSLLCLALLACGKDKDKEQPPSGQARPAPETSTAALGLEALPAATRVVIGVSVEKLAASPLARRLLRDGLARDPEAGPRLEAVLERCHLDLVRDLTSVTIAMGDPADVALLARGRFDGKALVDCVRAEVAGPAGTLRDESFAGRVLYGAEGGGGGQTIWLTVGPDEAALSTSVSWLRALVDPRAEKIAARPDLTDLLGRVDRTAAVWGVGFVPPEAGARMVEIGGGVVQQPARTVSFEIDAGTGVAVRLRLDMASAQDAAGLARFAKGQVDLLATAAQRWGLGQVVSKTEITSDGASTRVALRLDEAELSKVEAALGGQARTGSPDPTGHKEQPR